MLQIYQPYPDINVNVKILDEITLNKQCHAVSTILRTLTSMRGGWQWNPAITMWIGHDAFLGHYGHRLIAEWKALGYPDHWTPTLVGLGYIKTPSVPALPWWWGHQGFHDYNKAVLLKRSPDWYEQFFTGVKQDAIGWWPTITPGEFIRGPKSAAGPFLIEKHPVFDGVFDMSNEEFIGHANSFHNLTPDMKGGLSPKDNAQFLQLVRILHDRFHLGRAYTSHDHR
jgi:hypothetical protein